MKKRLAVIIDCEEIREEKSRAIDRYVAVGDEISKKYGKTQSEILRKVDADYLKLFEERSKLDGLLIFLDKLLQEE